MRIKSGLYHTREDWFGLASRGFQNKGVSQNLCPFWTVTFLCTSRIFGLQVWEQILENRRGSTAEILRSSQDDKTDRRNVCPLVFTGKHRRQVNLIPLIISSSQAYNSLCNSLTRWNNRFERVVSGLYPSEQPASLCGHVRLVLWVCSPPRTCFLTWGYVDDDKLQQPGVCSSKFAFLHINIFLWSLFPPLFLWMYWSP